MNVRQLQRIAKVILQSERLGEFLEQAQPTANMLTLTTDWINQHPEVFQRIAKSFADWQNKYGAINSLADTIRAQGDIDVQEDIKTALIQHELQVVDEALANLAVDKLTVGEALNITGMILREKYYLDNHFSEEKRACMDGFGALDLPQQKMIYKARPLEGIWATPPFLHNGSVPNIYQLLSPVSERDVSFWVGQREYDPVHLGYVTDESAGHGFKFDTQQPGNKNIGHEFRAGYVPYKPGNPPQYGVIGPELSPDERMAIIEYLKIHKDSSESDVDSAESDNPLNQCQGL